MQIPLISFVILTRNRRKMLVTALAGAREQRYPHKEIIVVDNASTDGTVEFVRSSYPEVKVVSNARNLGSAVGRNQGIDASSGDIIIFMDDDCILNSPYTARVVAEQFRVDDGCGAVAFRIADPTTWDEWPYNPTGRINLPIIYEVALFCTGGVALRRSVLEQVGGFWDTLFIGHVDTELALRVVRHGWRIMRRNDILVWHRKPEPRELSNLRRTVYFRIRNSVWLAARVFPVALMPSLLLPTCLRALQLAVRRGAIPFFVQAVVDALRGLPKCLKLRRPLKWRWVRRARRKRMKLWL